MPIVDFKASTSCSLRALAPRNSMDGTRDLGTRCSCFWICGLAVHVLGSENHPFLVRVRVVLEHAHCVVWSALPHSGHFQERSSKSLSQKGRQDPDCGTINYGSPSAPQY